MDDDEGEDNDPLSLHKYLYAEGDPIDGTDPSGFQDNLAELGVEESMSETLDAMAELQHPVKAGKNVQITIDDAPGNSNAQMRTLLSQFGITTMFFVEGEFAERRPGDVRAILGDGHQIGNHTWDHPNLTSLSDDRIKQELSRTDKIVKKITGKSIAPNWRPPYGATNGRVQGDAAAVGFTKQWLWDVDSLDWKFGGDPSQIINQVETGLAKCPKQTCDVLFHDKSTTVSALRLLLPRLKQEGNKLVNFP